MTTQRLILMKPAFLEGIMALPAKEVMQVMAKIDLLRQDPLPDGKLKKHLTHLTGKPYRIRSGDFRILYKFDHASVNVLTIRRRDESTYKQSVDADDDFELDLAEDLEAPTGDALPTHHGPRSWESYALSQEPPDKPLPEPITVELLNNLHVPAACHQRLLPLKTQNELLSCPGIPDEILLRIDQYMFDLPLVQIEQQQNLVLNETDDLLKYKEGELLTFLLKLSPEQEKYVHWSPNISGPTLVKGGPGTGKSTIALYRTRSLLEQLLRTGKTAPRLLFTTYTNALVKSSEQLLQQLLGNNAQYVRVQTADKLAYDILQSCGQVKSIASYDQQIALLVHAIATTPLTGNVLQQQAQRQTLARMGNDYLLQELNTVIVARQLTTLEAYLATPRSGRKVRLNATQRQLIWRIYERWRDLLQASSKETWQQRRARAEALVEHSDQYQRYDAVVIDEAQDLDPSLLRLLIKLCKTANRLFITADANQSIYGSGFTWNDVHQSLKFQGRTSILRANYRSTYEIGEAAQSYLASGALDSEAIDRHYINNGPLPDVRSVLNADHEAQLLTSFFKKACSSLRLTIGSCAVLCPSERVGKAIAASLRALDLEANFMSGQDLNLTRPGVKIMTLNSAKGLEFPIVALAGFVSSSYPIIPRDATPEELAEALARERRTMFVGMTRAMRALLVILPAEIKTPLLQGFDPTYWNTSSKI
jgi:superfamily I DNA/RNA helicase/mRNA-degrading endonuclease RelE of RelBE toxin-antitoxin system